MNPYKNLPGHRFWRRAISSVEPHAVDPVVEPKFRIDIAEKVATAGSCFAQHISRRLSAIGFNYFVPESGTEYGPEERKARGYGVFSARYGNIYTVRQLLQIFEEAFGVRPKSEQPWLRPDGRYVDPFRPTVEPAGYASPEDVRAARRAHIAYVRRMFLETDIFVFTLGLTESWVSAVSGDVFPLAPGVVAGGFDPNSHKFVNFDVDEVRSDLRSFLWQLKSVNPRVKVMLTVSPVPLIATYENAHVLSSTTYSKSVLRVAAETAKRESDWVDYFPSYEIITGNFSGGNYYEEDLREINGMGVSHAMRCFLKNYTVPSANETARDANVASEDGRHPSAESAAARSRMDSIVCDEELIERVSF
ncbi:GSCFA domain-containing protein [Paraburkholderia atlantica]|uniref:GSCFA domain-containing protein n=1 Tax=Paraburkholderia atlantica TaxID=2654982 RepID=UPI0018503BBA|nr:GSCFA domain-containing protein [Paraburkholderia atlantica]MBB5419362.1 hypothetical protein [Paraburkholderia atlantica]